MPSIQLSVTTVAAIPANPRSRRRAEVEVIANMSYSLGKKNTLRAAVLFVCLTTTIYGQDNSFNRVRYNGGSVDSKVDPTDWENRLDVAQDKITLALKDGNTLEIAPKAVTKVSYGQAAHRQIGAVAALAIFVSPVALFDLLHETRLHFIGIQYSRTDGKSGGVLLQGDKKNYARILEALQDVTGAPISVSERERQYIPANLKMEVDTSLAQVKRVWVPLVAPSGLEKSAFWSDADNLDFQSQLFRNLAAWKKLAPDDPRRKLPRNDPKHAEWQLVGDCAAGYASIIPDVKLVCSRADADSVLLATISGDPREMTPAVGLDSDSKSEDSYKLSGAIGTRRNYQFTGGATLFQNHSLDAMWQSARSQATGLSLNGTTSPDFVASQMAGQLKRDIEAARRAAATQPH